MARMPFHSVEDADEFIKQITQTALRWVRPIWWYDWQRPFERLKITLILSVSQPPDVPALSACA